MRLSLRAKGAVALAALVACLAVVALVLDGERRKLLDIALDLERIYERDAEVSRTEFSIHHSMLRLNTLLHTRAPSPSAADDIALDVELVQSGLQRIEPHFPAIGTDWHALDRHVDALRASYSHAPLVELQDTLAVLETRIASIDQELAARHQASWATYHRVYEGMTYIAATAMLFGVLVFGSIVSLFFTRLAWDIGQLEERAGRVVAGYRGDPLPVTRADEVGRLITAVNRMQSELRRHEQQLEIVRQQRFHQEKMAAVGSLAAAVAHEINNPIAAIAGIARSLETDGKSGGAADDEFAGEGPRLILQQTERISAISRQIAEFTRPHSPEPELTDLNRLVRSICKFTGYDSRLREIELSLDLVPDLPAIPCVADHVTQVLMNLLINAGDALKTVRDRKPAIRVSTRLEDGEVRIAVEDNGHGMDAAVRERAFEEGFTTKNEGQGLGLGLFLCKALLEADGGRIGLASTPGQGTTVTVHLSLQPAGLT